MLEFVAGKKPPASLLKQEYQALKEKQAKLPETVTDFITSIFGEEINDLQAIGATQGVTNATSVLKAFYYRSLDAGLLRETRYKTQTGQELITPPAPMLNRSAFIEVVSREIDRNQLGTFFFIDIAQLRKADRAGAADWMLNNIGTTLQSVISKTNERFKAEQKAVEITACRFGGDEFALAILGNLDASELQVIKNEIKQTISSLPGYYKDGESVKANNVALNEQKTKEIKIPTDALAQKIFFYYFKRGLLLSEEEIDNIKRRYPEKVASLDDTVDISTRIYPPDVRTLRDRINYVINRHQELGLPFFLAEYLDRKADSQETAKRQSALLRFIETILYDKLLVDNIYSFADFQDHYKRGQFGRLYIFETKFLKEINDNYSMVDGDKVIMAAWDAIKSKVPQADKDKIIVGRRGGMFLIGVRQGQILSKEAEAGLDLINGIQINLFKSGSSDQLETVTIPIGRAVCQVGDNLSREKLLGDTIRKSEDDWYAKILQALALSEKTMPVSSLRQLILLYFTDGARREERLAKAKQIAGNQALPLLDSIHF